MALSLQRHLVRARADLRFHPMQTRLRAELEGHQVADTTAGFIVWEPRRVVPSYAVPADDVQADLEPARAPEDEPTSAALGSDLVLTPAAPFRYHSTPGTPYDVRAEDGPVAEQAAFRPDDSDLAHTVFLDFAAFDWWEENEKAISHPRDPFHRIDIRPAARHVEVRFDGRTLADSDHALILTETSLPPRWYFPRADVAMDLLEPSDHKTTCAYKGHADHFSMPASAEGDAIAWTYEKPLHEAAGVAHAVAFYNERVDVLVDGELQDRPRTPWARARGH
ncbi:MAG TPA: DUF427 domain-containing protein [Nocardioidaceae bacterium]|jgi:uncharacterized protein (DUF427 family)